MSSLIRVAEATSLTSSLGDVLRPSSTIGSEVDRLFWSLLGITGLVALALALLLIVFCIKYRRGSRADRANAPTRARWIEVTWTATPLAIFIGIFCWSSVVFSHFYQPPRQAMRVHILARQWMWEVEHDNGKREINQLHVPLNQPVELIMSSRDVIHSFFIPAFRVKQDVLPGRYTSLWFDATQAGRFHLFCAEYCGTQHAGMTGEIVVLPPAQFAAWLASGPRQPDLASRGFEIYRRAGCSGCHEPASTVHSPDLTDLLGRVVHLQDGGTVIADEAYIRDSILLPHKHVVAGFAPVMPSYQGQLDESELMALMAFIERRSQPPRQ